jgi:hypothetical protein
MAAKASTIKELPPYTGFDMELRESRKLSPSFTIVLRKGKHTLHKPMNERTEPNRLPSAEATEKRKAELPKSILTFVNGTVLGSFSRRMTSAAMVGTASRIVLPATRESPGVSMRYGPQDYERN